ncbi:MAG: Ig-like domain-containing protein [Acidobacteriota bacterium]
MRHPNLLLALVVASGLVAGPSGAQAQAPTRRATLIEALRAYPGFFHGQAVAVVGAVARSEARLTLASETASIGLVSREPLADGPAEIRGVMLDIGRLSRDDPRLLQFNLGPLIQERYREDWPRPGEELVIAVTAADRPPAAGSLATPAIRILALMPERFEGEQVTIVGQFRGRNLYGDTPAAPRSDRDDFVLRAGDGAVWVHGVRARGRGFSLDPSRRIDTGRWLRVTGTVRSGRGHVWIDGTSVALAEAPSDAAVEVAGPPSAPPPIDVVFSAPTDGEIDVATTTSIRIQFSRDVDPATLEGRIVVRYAAGGAPVDAPLVVPALSFRYAADLRAVEIRFAEPLERFQRLTVELREGIAGPDGATLRAWSASFTTGGT